MSTEEIVAALITERDRLNQAIAILAGTPSGKRRGRPPSKKAAETIPAPLKSSPAPESAGPVTRKRRKGRKLSAEARARIAAAQKKRWSEFRKQK